MKIYLPVLMLIATLSGCASASTLANDKIDLRCDDIWTINTVTVRDGREAEAKLYYEAAWLPARAVAKRSGVIKDYRLLSSKKPDQPDLQLVTIYEDDAQFSVSEDAFQNIFKALNLPRPLIINGFERKDIIAETVGADDYRFITSEKGPC